MKRIFVILMLNFFLLSLCGCNSSVADTVDFYYCRTPESYQYFTADGVISRETREITGHQNDLSYVLRLYLAGPLEEGLISPFPRGTQLISARKVVATLRIELSGAEDTMNDSEFSLACACLARTCMSFVKCKEVVITCGERVAAMTEENVILYDNSAQETTTGG